MPALRKRGAVQGRAKPDSATEREMGGRAHRAQPARHGLDVRVRQGVCVRGYVRGTEGAVRLQQEGHYNHEKQQRSWAEAQKRGKQV